MSADEIEDLPLRMFLLPLMFANMNKFGIRSRQFEDLRIDQTVVQQNITQAEATNRFQGHKFGITWTSANQIQFALVSRTTHHWVYDTSLSDRASYVAFGVNLCGMLLSAHPCQGNASNDCLAHL
jgi:hypothetical protein